MKAAIDIQGDSGHVSPHMDVTGPYLEGAGNIFLQMHTLSGPEDARKTTRAAMSHKALPEPEGRQSAIHHPRSSGRSPPADERTAGIAKAQFASGPTALPPKAAGALLPGLDAGDQKRVYRFVSRSSAAATLRAYRSDWPMFVAWFAELERSPEV